MSNVFLGKLALRCVVRITSGALEEEMILAKSLWLRRNEIRGEKLVERRI